MSGAGVSRVEPRARAAKRDPRVAPPFRMVAVPAALALGSVGGIAAQHAHLPWIVGALAGALAAVLGVLALPSIPTRRVTVLLLGLGGLAALRHASFAGTDRSWLLVIWAAATMLTLVLVDRADAETVPALAGGARLPGRVAETARTGSVIAVVVVVAAVALVPTVTARLGRHVWPGLDPSVAGVLGAPSSLQSSGELGLTTRPRLSDAVVFTVDASHPDFWRGETFDVYNAHWTRARAGRAPSAATRASSGTTARRLPCPPTRSTRGPRTAPTSARRSTSMPATPTSCSPRRARESSRPTSPSSVCRTAPCGSRAHPARGSERARCTPSSAAASL